MLNNKQISAIIVMRGLGYTQQEIADKLKISRKTVENRLHILNEESTDNGIYSTYIKYIDFKQCMKEELKEETENERPTMALR